MSKKDLVSRAGSDRSGRPSTWRRSPEERLIAGAVACFAIAPIALLAAIFFRTVPWVVGSAAVAFWAGGLGGIFLLGGYGLQSGPVRRDQRRRDAA